MTKPCAEAASTLGSRRRGHRVLRAAMGGLALVFVVYAAAELRSRWDAGSIAFLWLPTLLSITPLALGAVLLAWGWKRLLQSMIGKHVPTWPAIALNLESQLARYAPGKLGVPMIRMAGAPSLGVSGPLAGTSLLIEMLSFVAVGGLVSMLLLKLGAGLEAAMAGLGQWAIPLLIAFGITTLLLLLLDRRRYPGVVRRLMSIEGTGPVVPVVLLPVHLGYWLTWAVHGYLVTRSVGGTHEQALATIGFYCLAPIAGFLALVTPGGIGVREAVLSIGLVPSIGPSAALAAAVISRAVSLVSDVCVWLGTRPVAGRRRQE